ncbi:MAG: D-alanyl-D-alanine carboxypeptidase [Clostridia bacterium]|nr:D-alanyl-D-alanine carboxypeptidase [Clostridia bacterium]
MKNVKIILVTFLLFMYTNSVVFAMPPETSGKSSVLMDGGSGRPLYEENSREKLPMASTTKIMTAIVALEHCKLDEKVIVAPEASGVEGSSIWLSPEETHTLEDLLYGLMLRSGNDAATAIAIHIGGSVEGFAKLMNQTARKIGAMDTNFMNPHGLHEENHYTTAYDLALITSYGMRNPDFEAIVSTKHHTIPWEGHKWDRAMRNKNKILWSYEGANGVKTGYTKKAGRCFVGSSKREGLQLVAVVLNCGPMFEESVALMDYGFANYKRVTLIEEGQAIQTLPIANGRKKEVQLVTKQDYTVALRSGETEKIRKKLILPSELEAPIEKGQWVGSLQIYMEDRLMEEIPLVTQQAVAKRTIWDFFRRVVRFGR